MKNQGTRELQRKAGAAVKLLKGLANTPRLLVLCELVAGEKSVGELVKQTGVSQPHTSQVLSRFKKIGVVKSTRRGKEVFYTLENSCVREMLEALWKEFCRDNRRKS